MNTSVCIGDLNKTAVPSTPRSTQQYFYDIEILFIGLTTGILAFVGFLENLFVIIFIIYTKGQIFLLVPSNIFLLSLASAEFLLCGVVLPLFILQLVHNEFYLCFINTGKFIALATVGSLLLLTLNKFMSVKWHLNYLAKMTVRRAFFMVIVVWTTASALLLFVFISYITGVVWLRQLLRYFLVIFFLLLFAQNGYLLRKSRQHRHQIKSQMKAITGKSLVMREDFHRLKTVFFTTCTFAQGWLPVSLIALCVDKETHPKYFHRLLSYSAPFVAAEAVIDPIIYFYRVGVGQRCWYGLKKRLFTPVDFVSRTTVIPFVVSRRVHNL